MTITMEPVKTGSKYDAPWNLQEAQALVAKIWEPLAQAGFHVGLTGSVLYKGSSDKDLDLIVYPHKTGEKTLNDAVRALKSLGFVRWFNYKAVRAARGQGDFEYGYDNKKVEIWRYNKKRVDIFFLS